MIRQKALPRGISNRPVGTPALTVRSSGNPPFAIADVAGYFKTHRLPAGIGVEGPVKITSLIFISDREVADRLDGESTGLPDNYPLGFASLSGKFTFRAPIKREATPAFSEAYAVFDAQTGNLLMVGSLK
jgi:hypothetical protein